MMNYGIYVQLNMSFSIESGLNSMKAKIPRKVWMGHPDSGGVKIPDIVKRRIEERIHLCAKEHFQGHFTRIEIRFGSRGSPVQIHLT